MADDGVDEKETILYRNSEYVWLGMARKQISAHRPALFRDRLKGLRILVHHTRYSVF